MSTHELQAEVPLSPEQDRLLRAFEQEADEVFRDLGQFDAPSDAALVQRLADTAIASGAAPALATGAGKAALGKVAVTAAVAGTVTIVAAALWLSPRPEPTTRAPAPTPVSARDPVPAPAPALAPAPAPAPEASTAPVPALPESGRPAQDSPRVHARPRPPTESPAPAPSLSARELLEQANTSRRNGDYAKAKQGYERLALEFPGSREDLIGRVSLGRLELERLGQPAQALRHFDAYLDKTPRGNLAEEALHGRAQALRRLTRPADELAAWRELLRRFPDSVHAGTARERVAELGG